MAKRNKTYKTFLNAYDDSYKEMVNFAKSRLRDKTSAVDAVHNTFVKALEYLNKNPGRNLSRFILHRELDRAVRRINNELFLERLADEAQIENYD